MLEWGAQGSPPSFNYSYSVLSFFALFYFLFSTSASFLDILFLFRSRKGKPSFLHILSFILSFFYSHYVTIGTAWVPYSWKCSIQGWLNSEELLRERFKFNRCDTLQIASIYGAFPVCCPVLFPYNITREVVLSPLFQKWRSQISESLHELSKVTYLLRV